MIARPAPDLCERIRRALQHFNLQAAHMAAELRIRPEWLSKILNGHESASYNLGLRFDDFLRRRGLDAETFARADGAPLPRARGAEPETLRKRIDEEYRSLLASVGDNVDQLETIADRIPLLRLPRREHPDDSGEARRTTTDRAPRMRKATNSGVVSNESVPRNDRTSPMVPREIDRRDIIAERFRALARGKTGRA